VSAHNVTQAYKPHDVNNTKKAECVVLQTKISQKSATNHSATDEENIGPVWELKRAHQR